MLNIYELNLIISLDNDQGGAKEIAKSVQDMITNLGGNILRVNNMGSRRMVYEIEKRKEGYYSVIYFETDSSNIEELERKFKLNRDIIRYMFIKHKQSNLTAILSEEELEEAESFDTEDEEEFDEYEEDYFEEGEE
jgi:small subunit ribosomal protein S6